METKQPTPSPEYEVGSQATSDESEKLESVDVYTDIDSVKLEKFGLSKPRRVIIRGKIIHGKS